MPSMSTDIPFHRRHLPHFYPPDAIYFVTSRLADSLPQSVIDRAKEERESLRSHERGATRGYSGLPPYIDAIEWWEKIIERGSKDAHLLTDTRIASLVAEAIHFRDRLDYDLIAYTIMPNHVHLVFGIGKYDVLEHPADGVPLSGKQVSAIMMSLKRHTALEANKLLERSGPFWQDESYDHVVRDSEELSRIVEYVLDNPVQACLAQSRRAWPWSYSRYEL